MEEKYMEILALVYAALGYWAVNQTILQIHFLWELFGSVIHTFVFKAFVGIVFGWILIPIALVKILFFRKRN